MGLEPVTNKIIFDEKQRLKNIYRMEFEAKIARMCKTRGLQQMLFLFPAAIDWVAEYFAKVKSLLVLE